MTLFPSRTNKELSAQIELALYEALGGGTPRVSK